MSVFAPAFSQVDTLQWRQREPTFYYWDDHYADVCGNTVASPVNAFIQRIYARHCYVDTTLKVIGVAAPVTTTRFRPGFRGVDDTVWSHRFPEYFLLYEATDTSFDSITEARYDTNRPRYRMFFPNVTSNSYLEEVNGELPLEQAPFVYEAYFDKPYLVRDSFYVGRTSNNNGYIYNEATRRYEAIPYYITVYYNVQNGPSCLPDSNLIKLRYTNPYDRTDTFDDYQRGMRMRWLYERGWIYAYEPSTPGNNNYSPIFPIFDTTGLDIHGYRWYGECDTVRGLRLLRIEDGKAYISWAADTLARWWEISYGPVGTSPENGTRDSTQTTMVCLENLQVGTEYVVYVRGRCKDDTRSPWSSFITFYMSDNETITLPEQTVVDRNTHVMPNPTGGLATIFSSFRISTIEVYTSTGSLVKTMQVHSNGAEFNASNLPAGTYILRIRTSHGDTAKRLVKQ
ncbi:MAG: T9SS type A sorting domain-containing protein [Bacteroidales bacterium]|nr:T9SS type A sorting domain-containing protein [Bacteroidales bacterium]